MVYRSREDVYRSRKNLLFSQEPAELYAREGQLRLPPCLAEMGGGTAALVQLSKVLDGAEQVCFDYVPASRTKLPLESDTALLAQITIGTLLFAAAWTYQRIM